MSSFPNFSNIANYVTDTLNKRKSNPISVSTLNCWARVISGVGNGLVMVSNPNIPLFRAVNQNVESLYGSSQTSGTIGRDWSGKAVNTEMDSQIGLPRPVISSFEVDEGSGNISRKASFTITVYTKKQLDEITKYFLEPGFTVFLEWGWNNTDGVIPLAKASNQITVDYVSKASSAFEIAKVREQSYGNYECYLGFITGGGIAFNGNSWTVSVNLTGFTELPSFLNVSDNTTHISGSTNSCGDNRELKTDKFDTIKNETDLGKKRYKTMYNELPSVRRTNLIKETFLNDKNIANPVNFVNFDESVRDKILNKSKEGLAWGLSLIGIDIGGSTEAQGESIPNGLQIIGNERFIRFGTLMDILNKNGLVSITVGNKNVSMNINTKNTPISAFERIFSIDKSKLIIPNPKTPRFSLAEAKISAGTLSASDEFTDCSIKYLDTVVKFPYDKAIINGVVDGDTTKLFYDSQPEYLKVNKEKSTWGFLDDLYVNFDFVSTIIDTPKLSMKDALYEILNGLSSAVNGLWNFQIQEIPKADSNGVVELRVIDLNFISENNRNSANDTKDIFKFELYGINSIFIDSSFDMDIGGNMMNKIIGERLSVTNNPSDQPTGGRLFAKGLEDKVLNSLEVECPPSNTTTDKAEISADEKEELEAKNLEEFIRKVGVYPKVEITEDNIGTIDTSTYFISYDDKNLFNEYKGIGDSIIKEETVSILLPIKFTFTVHGISGIKRGDTFVVNGLPDTYDESNGFFQVLSVKHTVQDMIWKTTIEGGFRQKRKL